VPAGVAVSFGSRVTEKTPSLTWYSFCQRATVSPAAVVICGPLMTIFPVNSVPLKGVLIVSETCTPAPNASSARARSSQSLIGTSSRYGEQPDQVGAVEKEQRQHATDHEPDQRRDARPPRDGCGIAGLLPNH